jgi:ABC-2 type transport system permease protein
MRYIRLIGLFIRSSALQELAYRANFWISLLHSALNLLTAVAGLVVLFGQVQSVRGWTFAGTLALLGVYLVVSALRGLVFGPSLDALVGMGGELWTGRWDFTMLRPADTQFLASLRHWRLFALVDLLLGLGVLLLAMTLPGQVLTAGQVGWFVLTLLAGVVVLYALLLAFSALTFWSSALLFTWLFDALFNLARYPVGIYPPWLRMMLTWVLPVGLITSVPAQALTGELTPTLALASLVMAGGLLVGASAVFRAGVRRYASTSS